MDLAATDLSQAGDGAKDRRFAGAIGADQGDGLALVDLQRYAFQRIDMIVVEFDVGEFQDLRS